MTKKLLAAATLLALATLAQMGMSAAQNSATSAGAVIHGNVTDPSGAVIPGAMVTLSSGQFSHTVSTDEAGQYSVSGLAAGHYKVKVQYGGFAAFERGNFVVAPGQQTEVNAQLELHETHQAVTVYE